MYIYVYIYIYDTYIRYRVFLYLKKSLDLLKNSDLFLIIKVSHKQYKVTKYLINNVKWKQIKF